MEEEEGEENGWKGYPGMSDDEVFKIVSRPEGWGLGDEGQEGMGIPEEVDPSESSDSLKVSYYPAFISGFFLADLIQRGN